MTVEVEELKVEYAPTGSTTGPFAVTFPFFELVVYLNEELVPTDEYYIMQDRPGQTGNVYFYEAPTGTLQIIRATEIEQQTDYITPDVVEPDSAERSLDRVVMILQEMDGSLSRTLRLPITADPLDPVDLSGDDDIPLVTDGDGNIQKFSPSGAGYVLADDNGAIYTAIFSEASVASVVRSSVDGVTADVAKTALSVAGTP